MCKEAPINRKPYKAPSQALQPEIVNPKPSQAVVYFTDHEFLAETVDMQVGSRKFRIQG